MDKVQEYRVYLKNLIMRYIGMSQEYRLSDTIQGRIGGAKCACEVALKEFNRIFEDIDQPTQPAESLHEMAKRWVLANRTPYYTNRLYEEIAVCRLADEAIEKLRKWASENPPKPVKTYREDFFEKFPEAPRFNNGYPIFPLHHAYRVNDSYYVSASKSPKSDGELFEESWDSPLGTFEVKP